MGWDAHTNAKKDFKNNQLVDSRLDRLFENASKYVKRKTGTCDWYLRLAGLDCEECGRMIEKATDKSVYVYNEWNPEKVKQLNKNANWNFKYDKELSWAYWSAKKFLDTCAKAGLSIKFSW